MVRLRRFGRIAGAVTATAMCACAGWVVADASGAARPIRPVLGDWEGSGPLGLHLSFALTRRGGHVVIADFSLGLPTGCRATGAMTWDVDLQPNVEYIAPGTVLHGPFPPLGPHQFELFLPPTRQQPLRAPFLGSFATARRGTLAVPSPTRYGCRHTRWPRTLRFALRAAARIRVADGLWTGAVTAPAGASGTVSIRVIGHGRIETDFAAAYSCPPPGGGSGEFEIGPLKTVGYLIAADGSIGATRGTQSVWRGRFGAGGLMHGTFDAPSCSPALHASFTAHRTGP
jgi:hypothetical protein